MPDLSTGAHGKKRFFGIFRLAERRVRESFSLSDDKTSNRRDIKDGCKTGLKRTDWTDDDIARWLDHGTRQFPRIEANPVRQLESSPSLEKDDCFGRCPD
jgi:hypothetical protein